MDGRRLHPVTGDADGAHQGLLPGANHAVEGPVRARDPIQRVEVADLVELDEVDPLDLQQLQRPADAVVRPRRRPIPVFVARKMRSLIRGIQGPSRPSDSPYAAAVSKWLIPAASASSTDASAASCVASESMAPP